MHSMEKENWSFVTIALFSLLASVFPLNNFKGNEQNLQLSGPDIQLLASFPFSDNPVATTFYVSQHLNSSH